MLDGLQIDIATSDIKQKRREIIMVSLEAEKTRKSAKESNLFRLSPIAFALLAAAPAKAETIEEVIVTATKRSQSVQEVPYNISALSGAEIENSGLINSGDILQQMPGIYVGDVGGRSNINPNVSIRGLNANNPFDNNIFPNLTEAPVATYVGDTPLFVNMKLTDIDRIEVLRGPQGTLYGSGSVGGAIRFVMNKPDPEAFEGSISASASATKDSDDMNYNTDVVLNVPLGDASALRVVAGWEDMGGFVDMPKLWQLESATGAAVPVGDYITSGAATAPLEEDTDSSETNYIRGSLLWDLSENVTAMVAAYHQEDEFDGDSFRRITNLASYSGPSNESEQERIANHQYETDMLNLEVTADLGFASLTSSTSWTENETDSEIRSSELYRSLDQDLDLYFGFPRITAYSNVFNQDEIFTQEFRLVSQGDSKVDWIVGAFYKQQDRDGGFDDKLSGYNDWLLAQGFGEFTPVDPAYNDTPAEFVREVDFDDLAVFGELTYHVTDDWQLTAGARYFEQDFEQQVRIRFPYCSLFCAADEEDLLGTTEESSEQDFDDLIFKFNTSYYLNSDHMAYFTFSQGFRHGGANALPLAGTFAVDPQLIPYEADEVDNWEVGLKGYLASQQYSYTLSYFRSDWDNIQLDAFLGLLLMPGAINGESARSQGVEFEIKGNVSERLVASFAYSYTDAQLEDTVDLAGLPAFSGDSLPGVSEHSLSVFADYTLPLSGGSNVVFHIDASYRSDFETTFNASQPSYAELDGFELVNTSATWNVDQFSVVAFINNLTDEEGVTAVYTAYYPETAFAFIKRPSTYGLTITYDF